MSAKIHCELVILTVQESIPYLGLGPYRVVRHNENETITYETEPFNNNNVNSRRAKPYHWRNPPEQH